jgi:hypothetical protein
MEQPLRFQATLRVRKVEAIATLMQQYLEQPASHHRNVDVCACRLREAARLRRWLQGARPMRTMQHR